MANGYICLDRTARLLSEKDFQIYEDIERYLSDNVGFSDLVLRNFRSLFVAYFSLLAFYGFIAFSAKPIVHRLRGFLTILSTIAARLRLLARRPHSTNPMHCTGT